VVRQNYLIEYCLTLPQIKVIMGKKRIPQLSKEKLEELHHFYMNGKSHSLRQRSHIILLKSQGHSSKYITTLSGYPQNENTINNWLSRYELFGIEGLKNKSGQGRKRILNKTAHETTVKAIVKSERQRLNNAKALIENELDVKMSKKTLTRFLKTLTEPISE
jgi:transposase